MTARCAGSGLATRRLWTGSDEAKWLGWLSIVEEQRKRIGRSRKPGRGHPAARLLPHRAARHGRIEPRAGGACRDVRAPDGWPELLVLDSTDPAQIRTIESKIDPARTLFIVSSKSGSTLEPNILKQYFFECVKRAVGADKAGSRFIAITDPGSKLQKVAERDRFRHIAFGIPSIGGRYSVLSDFGLVPAAAMGLDIEQAARRNADDGALLRRRCAAGRQSRRRARDRPGRAGQGQAATRSPSSPRPALPISAPGSNSSWPNRPASRARDSFRSTPSRSGRPTSTDRIACSFMCGCRAKRMPSRMTRSPRSNARVIRSCASPSPIAITSARNSSAGSSPRPLRVRSSASIRSISPMSRPARTRRAS